MIPERSNSIMISNGIAVPVGTGSFTAVSSPAARRSPVDD
jgi:hypothetical protein